MGNGPVTGDWKHILDTIRDMVVVMDTDRRIVWANRSLTNFLGLPEEAVIGRSCHSLFHGSTEPVEECPCERMAQSGKRETFERDHPGRDIRMRVTVDPLYDDAGDLAGAVHIISDVTAARRAELHSVAQSRRLELLTRIATSLLGDFAIGPMLSETACDLGRFLGVPRCTILLDGSPGEAGEHRDPDYPSTISAFQILSECDDVRTAFGSGRPFVLNDVRLRSSSGGDGGTGALRLGAFLGVPLRNQDHPVGALFLDRPAPHDWTQYEVETAEAVARQIAIAVLHARGRREQQELAGRLLSLMNNVPGVVYRGLRDWSLTFMGAEVETLTGYSADEFLRGAVGWREMVNPADLAAVKASFRKAVAGKKKVLRVEYRIRHRDGSCRWLEDRRQLVYGPGGEFVYVDGLLLDVTDTKRAEEESRRTNEMLGTLIEASPVAIMALDPEGFVTMWNPAAERIFGWTAKEAIGRMNPIVPPEKMEEFRGLRERVLRDGGFSGMELRRQRKDGVPIDISLSTAPIRDSRGNITGIMSVIADITERMRIEEALRESEEQFRQSQKIEAVGRLAGGVAHDFNNLLTAICGYADILLERLEEGYPHRKEVEEIRKAGERASSLTRQLLAFSRKQVLQPKVLSLNAVVSGMEEMLRRMIGENIDFFTVLRPDLWNVKVDRGQIEQVIMNLVLNARDAISRGGKITIETANVLLDDAYAHRHAVVPPGPYAMLAVSDTGCGMDEETKARLFEPFFTTKEKGKGTGLGLSTVYGIVKQSNGFVWAYSELHHGSTFKVYLPRNEEAAGKTEPDPPRGTAPRGRETILLVEDEEVVRMLVRDVLREHGYTVLEARDGAEAMGIGVSHRGTIHLMITDVVMPNMGGKEVAVSLAPLLREMKVMYMSGYTDDAVVRHGILNPGTQFLQKPFRLDALLRKVRQVLDA